jgi:ATP-dependent Clp protease protease subunit
MPCVQRIVRMGGPVDDDMANLIVAQLLYLDSAAANKDITMYVNSPGGSVTAGATLSRLYLSLACLI